MHVDLNQIGMTLVGKLMQNIISLHIIDGHKIDIGILVEELFELLHLSVGKYCLEYFALSKTLLHSSTKVLLYYLLIEIKILS
jgi:ABC-type uncharacterized transport system YnjBCD ATPase subunit